MSETDLAWKKATASIGANACVELAVDGHLIALRNSREPDLSLSFTPAEIAAFLAGAKAGEFDHLLDGRLSG